MAEIVTLAAEELRKRGKADAADLAARVVAGEVTDEELLNEQKKVPTWRPRDYTQIPVGTPYQWEGTIYKLLQQHDATGNEDWAPPTVPALWAAVSKPGETGTIDNPITAAKGMEYTYGLYYLDPEDSKIYLCTRTGEAEGGKVILQYLPHELIGQYFEEAETDAV
ncbi:hypothetical protein NE547_04095 [Flavonifractor sp. DFI.6.63]|uniref:hypothetical protein n=1 Tax=Flavonifractor sp. DFI.6.63 TaxID=2963704 RepID=UPI002109B32B|nr:hypothetical protein [Flavonifractor sp. DFI.6.63]MCQ5028716.1 hypothetical protein [Flavonifractor sp. DFI.6.63]